MPGLLKKILKSDKLPLIVTGLCLSLLVAALYVVQPGMLRFLNYKIYDQQLRLHHSTKRSGVPVIVDIDEKSLAALGQWPWPRYRMALLLEKIRLAGALAVGLDMVLAEPDRTSPARLRAQLKRELKIEVDFSGLPKALEDNDAVLANVLRDKPYALGFYFSFDGNDLATLPRKDDELLRPARAALLSAPDALPLGAALHTARGTVPPLAVLAEAASATGFFNTAPDQDGILRRVPLFIHYQGQVHPCLAMATLMLAAGDENVLLRLGPQGAESLRYGGTVIPVDRHGQLLVNYHGPKGGFPYLSASDILEDRISPAELAGKIVFIGTSAAGLKDLRATPFSPLCPGVEVHAEVVENILTQDFISVPDYAPALELIALLASGLAITLLATWARAVWIVLPLVGMGAGLWWGTGHLLSQYRVFVSPLYAYLILVANFGLLTLMKFWREERQRQFIHGAFSHYLAPAVINQIMESPESLSLQGQEKEVTIMFSDVRGFTSMSEKLTPSQVTDLLHDYLTPMTRVITENMGTLDKFIGDAIMAFWNAPLDVPGHQQKAVASALQMFEHLERLNEGFRQKYGLTINIGVGLHCGKVHVGNMGSAELFDYTLIGDNVNLTSRLEGLTKYYGQRLLVSEDMVTACGDAYAYLEMDCVRVKGKLKPIPIYTAMSHEQAAERREELDLHREALALYRQRRFAEARESFRRLLDLTGNHTLYAMYVERCATLELAPPPTDWDCVYSHTSK